MASLLGLQIVTPHNASQEAVDIVRNVQDYIDQYFEFGPYFPPMTSTDKPSAADWQYRGRFVTDTNKPAWSDGTTWRYADGSAV